ncbi:MAG TPA: sodium:solute symporter family protein [Sedimentisphaerales bacterium]|nr:sodium:solute symporter family protein [Sedimentisphaerales bacterium]
MIYLVCIFAYLLLLAGIGIRQSRRVKSEEDFTVAGRSLSPWVMVCTMLAVWIGTGSIVGNAEQTYKTGMAALILPIGTFFGMILLSLIASRARNIEATSVPGIIQSCFGNTARGLAMLSLIIAYMVIVSYQFNAGGAVLEVIAGDKPPVIVSSGDQLTRRQLLKGRLVFAPEEDWAGSTSLTLVTDSGPSAATLEWPVHVVVSDDLKAAKQDAEKAGRGTAVKRSGSARLYLNADLLSGSQYTVASVPDHGTLTLVEPILTARTATLIAAICIVVYTMLAGLMSLASMDILNGSAIMLTMVIALPVYWFKAGGGNGMEAAFAAMGDRTHHMQFWGVYSKADLINYILPVFLLVLGDANQYQRIFASRNAKGAKTAVTVMIFVAFAIELLIIACAWIVASMTPDPENGKYILIYAAKHYLALPIGCLFMVTVVAIIFSTANSFLHVSASTAITDVYLAYINPKAGQKCLLFLSRLMVVVFGLIAFFVTLMFAETTGFFRKALYAFTIYGSSITPTLVAAIVWKRATTAGAVASILTGTVVSLVWSEADFIHRLLPPAASGLDAVLPALLASVTCLVVVSLLTKKRICPKDATFTRAV